MSNKRMLWLAALLLTAGSAADSYAQSGIQYPYTTSAGSTSGKASVIVSRDAAGGVKSACIHANWKASTMPAHNEQDAANAVSARFEVASADLSGLMDWSSAQSGCAGYTQTGTSAGDWRLPTQRELMLIWVMYMRGELTGLSFRDSEFWSNTNSSTVGTALWSVGFESNSPTMRQRSAIGSVYVRCVRDF
jgi:hypothetical protein